jgi:choline dehydrogenase-like flavoprotein
MLEASTVILAARAYGSPAILLRSGIGPAAQLPRAGRRRLGHRCDGIGDDDVDGLARSIRARVGPYHHPAGTCVVGPDPTSGAVVDARGAAHGIDRLCVADASVRPTIPSANTNLPTSVVAERIASWFDGGH